MTKDEEEVFMFLNIFNHFADKYTSSKLELRGKMVYMKGELKFNTDGYNLLYNLTRLCEILKDELL